MVPGEVSDAPEDRCNWDWGRFQTALYKGEISNALCAGVGNPSLIPSFLPILLTRISLFAVHGKSNPTRVHDSSAFVAPYFFFNQTFRFLGAKPLCSGFSLDSLGMHSCNWQRAEFWGASFLSLLTTGNGSFGDQDKVT